MDYQILTAKPHGVVADEWSGIVASAKFATHYTTPAYFDDPYVSGERIAVIARDGSHQICGVVTGVISEGRVVCGMHSRPQMVFVEHADRAETTRALISGLNILSKSVEMYSWEDPNCEQFPSRTGNDDASVMMLDLSIGADEIFKGFSQTRRNEIRKAEKSAGVEVRQVAVETELADLFEIKKDWSLRKGVAAGTFDQLRAAAEQKENRLILVALVEGKVVAGSLYRFCRGGVVEYAANYSMPEYQKLRPNDLIGWHAIKWAASRDFSHFSMGGSHLFLRRFGGEMFRTYCTRTSDLLDTRELKDAAKRTALAAYRRLPVGMKSRVQKLLVK